MFLRIIRSLDKTIRFHRLISQTSPNPIKSRSLKPLSLSTDVSSSMKLSVTKRVPRKKPIWKATNVSNQRDGTSYFNVCAYATADWYDLDRLKQRLLSSSTTFQFVPITETFNNVLCIKIPKQTSSTNSQAFIFDDGAVVLWNVEQDYEKLILNHVNEVSDNQYPNTLIQNEKEIMNFVEVSTASSLNHDIIKLNCQSDTEQLLDQYTFSNALALSVKLGRIKKKHFENKISFFFNRHLGSFIRR
jgi:uncharacterized Rmd1/YagE family protein